MPLQKGQPWAEVKHDLSKAGCLDRLESLRLVSGEKGRNCQTVEDGLDSSDLGGKGEGGGGGVCLEQIPEGQDSPPRRGCLRVFLFKN